MDENAEKNLADILKDSTFPVLVRLIHADWQKVSPYAAPYLNAMDTMQTIDAPYYADSGRSCVLYFLSNASSWQGPMARAIKAELNKRLGVKK